jgi:uncharacterized membrane protein YedE/YeeE
MPRRIPPHVDRRIVMTELTASPPLAVARPARLPQWARLGMLFGLVSIAAILLYGPIGVSSTYPRAVGALWRLLDPTAAGANAYLVKMGALLKPETMLVVGLLIGGFLAARVGRGATRGAALDASEGAERVHPGERTTTRRYVDAFVGGALIVFGARLAGGCTSGHIISGITQLAVSGVLFGAAVFATGILTAKLLKGGH